MAGARRGQGDDADTEGGEVERRLKAVMAARDRLFREAGLDRSLTPDELDLVLPAVDCHRTRARLARKRRKG